MQMTQPAPADPGLPSMRDRATEFTVGGVISRTFSVWWKNVFKLTVVTLLAWLPALVAIAAVGAWAAVSATGGGLPESTRRILPFVPALGILLSAPFFLAAIGGVTYGAVQHIAGNPVRLGAMLGAGFRRIWPLFLVGVLSFLVVLGGTLLLVIPGIIFAFAVSVAIPAVVAERIGPVEAIRRSFALTKGNRLLIFAATLVVGLANGVAGGIFDALTAFVGERGVVFAIVAVMSAIVKLVFAALPTVLPAVVYHDLRVANEGADTADLAKVFE
jgi:hypothetical protein